MVLCHIWIRSTGLDRVNRESPAIRVTGKRRIRPYVFRNGSVGGLVLKDLYGGDIMHRVGRLLSRGCFSRRICGGTRIEGFVRRRGRRTNPSQIRFERHIRYQPPTIRVPDIPVKQIQIPWQNPNSLANQSHSSRHFCVCRFVRNVFLPTTMAVAETKSFVVAERTLLLGMLNAMMSLFHVLRSACGPTLMGKGGECRWRTVGGG